MDCKYNNWVKSHETELKIMWEAFKIEFKDYVVLDKEVETFTKFCEFSYSNSNKHVFDKSIWLTEEEEIQHC